MRTEFWQYYPPTPEWFNTLWSSATVVLDSSVLLDLYRYDSQTLDDFTSVFEQFAKAERLWLPYHVGVEYHSRRAEAVSKEAKQPYTKARKHVDELESDAAHFEHLSKHAFIESTQLAKIVRDCAIALRRSIDSSETAHPDYLTNDPIQQRLADLFDGRVGPDDVDADEADFIKKAERRYARRIPPGFEDAAKADNKYGDLVIWIQMKNYANSRQTDILFVTNDSKSDWWSKAGDAKLGPHPMLRREFRTDTGRDFYAYSSEKFLHYAREYVNAAINDASIAAVRERREMDEQEHEIAEDQQPRLAGLSAAEQAALIQVGYDQLMGSPLRRAMDKVESDRASFESAMLRSAMEEVTTTDAFLRATHELAQRRALQRRALEAALARRAAARAAGRGVMEATVTGPKTPTVEHGPRPDGTDADLRSDESTASVST
jgi:hypothetical protein